MLRFLVINTILLYSLQTVLSANATTSECPLYTWQCNNGQCIKSEELCDGDYDCADRSDETVEECLLRPCPSFAFQCTYGACITGNFKCNGIVNCVDGSDETRFLCQSELNYEKEIQGNCGYASSMQCKSGECISNERLCDGQIDCRDGSDETVEMCSFLKCPEYSFRCGYGACVTGLSACDGIKDCRDGSDEIPSLCSNITDVASTTIRPHIPEVPTHTTIKPTTISTTTSKPFLPTTDEIPPISENHCSSNILMRGISSVPKCYYQNREVTCYRDIQPGTTANISCAPGYVERQMNRVFPVLKCDPDGEWNRSKRKCIPECGTLTDDQKNSFTKPWDVTIFKREMSGTYEPICSGVIVSIKIVLTAGNCFLSQDKVYNTDHIFYSLIQGHYNNSYSGNYHFNADVHNISSISIKDIHKTESLAVLALVNYFKFSKFLKPICLPTPQSNPFVFYTENRLNIGRPIIHDTNRINLEYLIASVELKSNGRNEVSYVNIYRYVQFIHREMKKYDYLL